MSALVEFATCKLCGVKLELPKLPPTVGDDSPIDKRQVQKFEKVIGKHMQEAHREVVMSAVAWQAMFAGYFFLSQFETDNKLLRMIADHQRLSLLRGVGRRMSDDDLGTLAKECADAREFALKLRALYEEAELEAALVAGGLAVPGAFVEKPSPIVSA